MSDEETNTSPDENTAPAAEPTPPENQAPAQPDELAELKQRADIMGIKYNPRIGVDTLRARIQAKIDGDPSVDDEDAAAEEQETIATSEIVAGLNTFTPLQKPTPAQLKAKRKQDALRMQRVRITCMNPAKRAWMGEIFSVGNSEIGMIKKYVPFNAEQGWHVPTIMLGMIKDRKYLTHYEVKIGNKKIKRTKLVPEFAVEILPPLTSKELQELKQRQLMAQGSQE
jgi:hypothetical protein